MPENVVQEFAEVKKAKETLQNKEKLFSHDTENDKKKEDLQKYKVDKFNEIAKKADILVSKIGSEILGKSLSTQDHEKLIFAALEKAKKEDVINFERL